MSIWKFLVKKKPIEVNELSETEILKIMHKDVVYVTPDTTVIESIKKMREGSVNYLIVLKESESLVGVVTDGDILYSIYKKRIDPETTKIGDIMTSDVKTVLSSDSIKKALEIMIENKVRRLPVIEKKDHLIGIISMTDIEDYAGYSIVMKI